MISTRRVVWGLLCVPLLLLAGPEHVQAQENSTSDVEAPHTLSVDSLRRIGNRLHVQRGCQACHSTDGTRKVGPTYKGLYGRSNRKLKDGTTVVVDEEYLRRSILKPEASIAHGYPDVMPGAYHTLSERQLRAIVEFIKAQSDKEPGEQQTTESE